MIISVGTVRLPQKLRSKKLVPRPVSGPVCPVHFRAHLTLPNRPPVPPSLLFQIRSTQLVMSDFPNRLSCQPPQLKRCRPSVPPLQVQPAFSATWHRGNALSIPKYVRRMIFWLFVRSLPRLCDLKRDRLVYDVPVPSLPPQRMHLLCRGYPSSGKTWLATPQKSAIACAILRTNGRYLYYFILGLLLNLRPLY
ncbi:hypothetical protein LX36DRAFT_157287 [Colletotrichum falcatum]|nr:hypothetical protein LX36DRAFT_157287 [Colletotrichum falcatum]